MQGVHKYWPSHCALYESCHATVLCVFLAISVSIQVRIGQQSGLAWPCCCCPHSLWIQGRNLRAHCADCGLGLRLCVPYCGLFLPAAQSLHCLCDVAPEVRLRSTCTLQCLWCSTIPLLPYWLTPGLTWLGHVSNWLKRTICWGGVISSLMAYPMSLGLKSCQVSLPSAWPRACAMLCSVVESRESSKTERKTVGCAP